MDAFTHLHVRSGFSWDIGTATPEDLVERTADLGMRALALTDRNTLAGIPRLQNACIGAGVLPLVGAEITVRTMGARGQGHGHVVLLAVSDRGYRSLCSLLTDYLCRAARKGGKGFWPSAEQRRHPVCSLDTLLEHATKAGGHLICLTGAVPFGLLPTMVLQGCRRPAFRRQVTQPAQGGVRRR